MRKIGIMLAAATALAAPVARPAEMTAPAAPAAPSTPAAPAPGGQTVTLTLEDAIRIALASNPGLQSVQGLQRQAEARIGEARAAAGPAINALGTYTETGPIAEFTLPAGSGQPARRVRLGSPRNRTAEVDATYRPDISGRTRSSVRIARAGAEAAQASTAVTINNLTQQVQSDYYGALRDQALVEVRRQAVADAQEQLRIAQAQFRAGTVPQFDVLRASVQVENLRQNQTVAETNAQISIANLIDVLGIDPTTRVELAPVPVTPLPPPLPFAAPPGGNPPSPPPGTPGVALPTPPLGTSPAPAPGATGSTPPPPGPGAAASPQTPAAPPPATAVGPRAGTPLPTTEAEAFREALAARPEVQQARETLRLNREQIRFEARAHRPELALTGSYALTPDNTGLAAIDHTWRLGASVSLDVFDAGLTRSRVRAAEAGRDSAAAQLAQAEQSVALDVRTALLNLREALDRRQTTAANVQQAQEALRIAQVRYRAGVSTNVEVTDAQVALTEAQTNQVNAEYDYLNAEAALARAVGRYAPPTAGPARPPAPAPIHPSQ